VRWLCLESGSPENQIQYSKGRGAICRDHSVHTDAPTALGGVVMSLTWIAVGAEAVAPAPLPLDSKNTVYLRQLTRGFRVGMPKSLTTLDQRQFAGNVPANLMHCADSPEIPGVIEIAVGIPHAASDCVVFRNAIGALK